VRVHSRVALQRKFPTSPGTGTFWRLRGLEDHFLTEFRHILPGSNTHREISLTPETLLLGAVAASLPQVLIRSSGSCPSRLGKMVDIRSDQTYDAAATRLSCRPADLSTQLCKRSRTISGIAGDCVHFFLSIYRQVGGGKALDKREPSGSTHRAGERPTKSSLTSPTNRPQGQRTIRTLMHSTVVFW
jgi:hypothetical protein